MLPSIDGLLEFNVEYLSLLHGSVLYVENTFGSIDGIVR